jgi:hypothetical protein
MSNTRPIPAAAVRTAYHEELNEGQRSALLSWLSFTGTFALTRGITYSIRAGWGPPCSPRPTGCWPRPTCTTR